MKTVLIALANQKGGVGKTTTSVNLAACLAERGKRTLLIDLDPQANATSGLGVPKEEGRSIYRALLGEGDISTVIRSTSYKRLDLVPAEVDLAGAEIDVARSDRYLHRFSEAVTPLKESGQYHFIVVDCPPSLGILTMNALTAADAVLIPMQCEYYALEGLTVMTRIVQQLRDSQANANLEIEGIVMTMYDMRTNLAQQVVQEVISHFGDKVYETLIPRSIRLSEAPSFGQPITAYDRNSTGAAAYRQLARELVGRYKAREEARPPVDAGEEPVSAGAEGPAAADDVPPGTEPVGESPEHATAPAENPPESTPSPGSVASASSAS